MTIFVAPDSNLHYMWLLAKNANLSTHRRFVQSRQMDEPTYGRRRKVPRWTDDRAGQIDHQSEADEVWDWFLEVCRPGRGQAINATCHR